MKDRESIEAERIRFCLHVGQGVTGQSGYVVAPIFIGEIASTTNVHTALFVIPFLTAAVAVAVATGTAETLRHRSTA